MAYTEEDIANSSEQGWKAFCRLSAYGTVGVIVALILMWAFLI